MKQHFKCAWLACLFGLLTSGGSTADEEPVDEVKDENLRRCVNTRTIRSTEIMDDLNILFYTRGKTIYHNRLPRQCHGLSREQRFSYRTTNGNLCNLDMIRILYRGGTGLQEGNACSLGYFREVTEEDVEAMLERMHEPPKAKPLPPAEPEEIIEESDES